MFPMVLDKYAASLPSVSLAVRSCCYAGERCVHVTGQSEPRQKDNQGDSSKSWKREEGKGEKGRRAGEGSGGIQILAVLCCPRIYLTRRKQRSSLQGRECANAVSSFNQGRGLTSPEDC
jgi:hypothetical protein